METCEKAIQLNPELGETYKIKCMALLSLGKIEEAQMSLKRLIEINHRAEDYLTTDPSIEVTMYDLGQYIDNMEDNTVRNKATEMINETSTSI